MREHSRRARFAEKPLAQFFALLRVVDIVNPDGLDGDGTADRRIGRMINHAHRAAAEFADDPVAADGLHHALMLTRSLPTRSDARRPGFQKKSIATSSTQKRAPRRERKPRCPPCSGCDQAQIRIGRDAG
jgi:hypothetical protein